MSVLPKSSTVAIGRCLGLVQSVCRTVMSQQLRFYAIPNPSYIHQTDTADNVVQHVRKKQHNKDSVLIINNPGTPALVKKFMKVGVKHIVCTAVDKDDINTFKKAFGKQDVLCIQQNVMKLNKDKFEIHIVSKLPVSIYEKGVTILTTLRERKTPLLNESVFSVITNKCMAYHGLLDTPQTEFFIFLTNHKYKAIQERDWLYSYKIYQAFFNCSHVMELKSTDFTPALTEDKGQKMADTPSVHLVHFTPNHDILSKLSLDDRKKFKKFIRFCIHKDTIITFLERSLPGCGLHLIKMGFTMNDENMTLTAEQYFNIYINMYNWPGFQDSSLRLLLEGRQYNQGNTDWTEEKP